MKCAALVRPFEPTTMRSASKSLAASRSTLGGVAGDGLHHDLGDAGLLGDLATPLGQLLGLHPVGQGEAEVVGDAVGTGGPAGAAGHVGGDDHDAGALGGGHGGRVATARSAVGDPSVPTTMLA